MSPIDPLQLHWKLPLDARALGDLSAFPALCGLTFECCEVSLCESMVGAVRHAAFTSLSICFAHPAPQCTPMVLQLSQALGRLRRGSVLKLVELEMAWNDYDYEDALRNTQTPFHKFKVASEACGL